MGIPILSGGPRGGQLALAGVGYLRFVIRGKGSSTAADASFATSGNAFPARDVQFAAKCRNVFSNTHELRQGLRVHRAAKEFLQAIAKHGITLGTRGLGK